MISMTQKELESRNRYAEAVRAEIYAELKEFGRVLDERYANIAGHTRLLADSLARTGDVVSAKLAAHELIVMWTKLGYVGNR